MDIKDGSLYSIQETANIVEWSTRQLQRRAKKIGCRKIDNRYLFTGHQVKDILLIKSNLTTNARHDATTTVDLSVIEILNKEIEKLREERDVLNAKLTEDIPHQEKLREAIKLVTLEAMDQGVTHKIFSEEEYEDIIGTLAEVDFQKEQVNYLRGRVEKQDEMLQQISAQIRERNYIEAKDKGYDKPT